MSRRFWMVTISIAAHAALGAGVFISGVWKLERLDPERSSLAAIGVMMAPDQGGSPAPAAPKVELAKQPTRIARDLTQITKTPPEPAKVADATPASGSGDDTGSGAGSGTGSGAGSGSGLGSGSCLAPPCQAAPPPVTPPPPVVAPPAIVPPTTLQALFISGDRQVHPSTATKQQMLRDDRPRVSATVKACIGEAGNVTSVVLLGSTKYPDYDARLVAAVRGWRYRPYQQGGKARAVCGPVTFLYTIK